MSRRELERVEVMGVWRVAGAIYGSGLRWRYWAERSADKAGWRR
jgi:hypothetical protein